MIIGFTGTQKGMTQAQINEVIKFIAQHRKPEPGSKRLFNEAHHGDCVGADAQFNRITDSPFILTVAHPASDVTENKKANCPVDIRLPAKPALVRNHDIVDTCDILIACPKEFAEARRSGTWATIRYARRISRKFILISPDGTVVSQN